MSRVRVGKTTNGLLEWGRESARGEGKKQVGVRVNRSIEANVECERTIGMVTRTAC